jgi:hypothetical protein
MATIEESYIMDHPHEMGYPVPATRPDGHASGIGGNRLPFRPGNVIAVKVGPAGYCISGYNKAGAKATSATKSFVYKSDQGGMQTAVGVCQDRAQRLGAGFGVGLADTAGEPVRTSTLLGVRPDSLPQLVRSSSR